MPLKFCSKCAQAVVVGEGDEVCPICSTPIAEPSSGTQVVPSAPQDYRPHVSKVNDSFRRQSREPA